MTDRKEKILKAALELFAKDGYRITSTSKVAKRAEVSEGLIFRHFGNKDGLLEAIIKEGEDKSKILFSDIIFETDPEKVISKTLDMMIEVSSDKEEFEFWKLQYKIKWETEQYGEHKMEPLQMALENAFTKLGYESDDLEALLLLVYLDGFATRSCLQKSFDQKLLISFLKKRYGV